MRRRTPEDGASAGVAATQCSFGERSRTSRAWRWKMAPRPRHGRECRSSSSSSTSSSCWRAPFALVAAAPSFLGHRPTRHPIGKTGIAVVGLRRRHTSTSLIRATFAMNPAAPFLLGHRPACLPVSEAILAVVRICRGWRLRRLTTNVVDPAAPLLLALVPRKVLPDSAVVWIDRANGSGRCCRRRRPRRIHQDRPCRRWRGRWRGRRRGKRRGRKGRRGLWQSCGRAAPTNGHTAILLLRLGPRPLDESIAASQKQASLAIVGQRGGVTRQEPEQ